MVLGEDTRPVSRGPGARHPTWAGSGPAPASRDPATAPAGRPGASLPDSSRKRRRVSRSRAGAISPGFIPGRGAMSTARRRPERAQVATDELVERRSHLHVLRPDPALGGLEEMGASLLPRARRWDTDKLDSGDLPAPSSGRRPPPPLVVPSRPIRHERPGDPPPGARARPPVGAASGRGATNRVAAR